MIILIIIEFRYGGINIPYTSTHYNEIFKMHIMKQATSRKHAVLKAADGMAAAAQTQSGQGYDSLIECRDHLTALCDEWEKELISQRAAINNIRVILPS